MPCLTSPTTKSRQSSRSRRLEDEVHLGGVGVLELVDEEVPVPTHRRRRPARQRRRRGRHELVGRQGLVAAGTWLATLAATSINTAWVVSTTAASRPVLGDAPSRPSALLSVGSPSRSRSTPLFSSASHTACTCRSHSYAAGTLCGCCSIKVRQRLGQRAVRRLAHLEGAARHPELGAEPEHPRARRGQPLGEGVDRHDVGRGQLQHPRQDRQRAPSAQPLTEQQRAGDAVAHLGGRLAGEGDQGDLVGPQVAGWLPAAVSCEPLVASR